MEEHSSETPFVSGLQVPIEVAIAERESGLHFSTPGKEASKEGSSFDCQNGFPAFNLHLYSVPHIVVDERE